MLEFAVQGEVARLAKRLFSSDRQPEFRVVGIAIDGFSSQRQP